MLFGMCRTDGGDVPGKPTVSAVQRSARQTGPFARLATIVVRLEVSESSATPLQPSEANAATAATWRIIREATHLWQ